MDASVASYMATTLLPADAAGWVQQNMLHPQSYVQAFWRHVAAATSAGLTAAGALMVDNQGVAGALVLVVLTTALIIVLQCISRLVIWWTQLVLRIVFWTLVAAVGVWVWNRGFAKSLSDAIVVAGTVAGYLSALRTVWLDEYNRYQGQQQMGGGGAKAR